MRIKTGKVKKGAEAPFTHRGYPFTTSLTNNLLNTYFPCYAPTATDRSVYLVNAPDMISSLSFKMSKNHVY